MRRPSGRELLLGALVWAAIFLYVSWEDLVNPTYYASYRTGWTVVEKKVDGFAVVVPASWREIPIDPDRMNAQAAQLAETNPELASAPSLPPSQTIKYHAYDAAAPFGSRALVEIGNVLLPSDSSLDQVAEIAFDSFNSVDSFAKPIARRRVQLNAGPAEEITSQLGVFDSDRKAFLISWRMYLLVRGRFEYVMMLGAGADRASDYEPVFAQVANSFSWR